MDVSGVSTSVCLLVCTYGFLSKSYCINNIMLFCKASLSLCYFVQPFLSLLSTITACNMNLVKRSMWYFKHLPFTVPESQACTQNLSEASILNLKQFFGLFDHLSLNSEHFFEHMQLRNM